MKNAREFEKKIKKLLSDVAKVRPAQIAAEDHVRAMIECILQADASHKAAETACAATIKEFVDFNEMRVAPVKELADCMGRDFPFARDKAESIIRTLNSLVDRNGNIGLDYLFKLTKRDLRRHLAEIGLSPYAASCLALLLFDTHAIPVDRSLVECLEIDGFIHAGSDLADVQGFLERIVSQKDALSVHEFFRKYVEKNAKVLAKKHKADAELAARQAKADLPAPAAPGEPIQEAGGFQDAKAIPILQADEDEDETPVLDKEALEEDKPAAAKPKPPSPAKPPAKKKIDRAAARAKLQAKSRRAK